MARRIELASLDLRYEGRRMKSPALESRLLISIQERGIGNPLEGVDLDERRILLNGFKRYRCAKRLGRGVVPYASLGSDEAAGIIAVLRSSNDKSLSILEQARFIDDLIRLHDSKPLLLAWLQSFSTNVLPVETRPLSQVVVAAHDGNLARL